MSRETLHLPPRGRRDAVDWEAAANRHRPTDPGLLADQVHAMARRGLQPLDIAGALRLDLAFVLSVLASRNGTAGG